MLLFLKSTDCLDIFPENTANHFLVKLPETVKFRVNVLKCALVQLKIPLPVQVPVSIVILTNFVLENYIGCRKLPVIHRCFLSNPGESGLEFQLNLLYVDVKDLDTDIVEVNVLDANTFSHLPLGPGILYCGFHIIET
jgi:hypothetical protein